MDKKVEITLFLKIIVPILKKAYIPAATFAKERDQVHHLAPLQLSLVMKKELFCYVAVFIFFLK